MISKIDLTAASWFRLQIAAFAGVLGVAGVWVLLIEIVRPNLPYFPYDRAASEAAAEHRAGAGVAASVGLVRGDLWTDYAITLAPDMSDQTPSVAATHPGQPAAARAAASQAVRLGPLDARAWLLLAAIDARPELPSRKTSGLVKMAYYTAPNDVALMPLRIKIATSSDVIADPDLQILVGSEIRTIITRRAESKSLIVAAYRDAPAVGKRFIESTVADLDPNLLATLRPANRPR